MKCRISRLKVNLIKAARKYNELWKLIHVIILFEAIKSQIIQYYGYWYRKVYHAFPVICNGTCKLFITCINKWWIDDICLIYIVLTITSWNNTPWIESFCKNNTCTCSKTRGWDFQGMKFEFASLSLCTQNKFFAHLNFPDHLLPDISTL